MDLLHGLLHLLGAEFDDEARREGNGETGLEDQVQPVLEFLIGGKLLRQWIGDGHGTEQR